MLKKLKFRGVVMLLVVCVFGVAATSAFALTSGQKYNNYLACRKEGGSFKACCLGAGGIYEAGPPIASCQFDSDRISVPGSIFQPPVTVGMAH